MKTREAPEGTNLAVARRMWLAAAEGDARALEDVLAKDVIWRVHGNNSLSGLYTSRDTVIGNIVDFADRVDDLRLSLRDVYASAEGAVVHYDLWARRDERILETPVLLRLRIEDSRIVESDVVPENQGDLDAFLNWIH